jgi:transcriptional regulator of acetoin/glycerol metabolism
MKKYTVEAAASAVRKILRAFSAEDQLGIVVLAMRVSGVVDYNERAELERVMASVRGSVTQTAKVLGVSRRTVQQRMRRLGLPPARDGRPPHLAQDQESG